ncbi:hypothetical protein Tcan_05059 [Toxocara canis]|uniref:Uncharacterized protein n=1 Tax=Toxocara canis TaxID=6265 RepID=A0A0B2V7I4_TOXCA|nr:hypothetical protein Tcan_05059 [Toxocara canis]
MGDFSGPPFFVFVPFIAFVGIFVIIVCVKVWGVFSHNGDWRYFYGGHRRQRRYPRRTIDIGFLPYPPPLPPSYYSTFPPDTASPVHYPLYSAYPNAPVCEQLSSESFSQREQICGNVFNSEYLSPPAYPPPPPYTRYDQYPPMPVLPNSVITTPHRSCSAKPTDDFPAVE